MYKPAIDLFISRQFLGEEQRDFHATFKTFGDNMTYCIELWKKKWEAEVEKRVIDAAAAERDLADEKAQKTHALNKEEHDQMTFEIQQLKNALKVSCE